MAKTVLCYGDSNTFGSPGRPLEVKSFRHPRPHRWTTILQNDLGPEYEVIAEGLPGRTTVHDDPIEGAYKNGRRTLLAILESHAPVDAVILMLGTNDLKARFALSAYDIAQGAGVLLKIIRDFSIEQGPIEMLLVSPPPILDLGPYTDMFAGGAGKSRGFAPLFRDVAGAHGAAFLDAGTIIQTSSGDGIHFDAPEHARLGVEIAKQIRSILG